MYSYEFFGSKMGEGLENFIDKVWRILCMMHENEVESVDFATYKLKDFDKTWFDQWNKYLV